MLEKTITTRHPDFGQHARHLMPFPASPLIHVAHPLHAILSLGKLERIPPSTPNTVPKVTQDDVNHYIHSMGIRHEYTERCPRKSNLALLNNKHKAKLFGLAMTMSKFNSSHHLPAVPRRAVRHEHSRRIRDQHAGPGGQVGGCVDMEQ